VRRRGNTDTRNITCSNVNCTPLKRIPNNKRYTRPRGLHPTEKNQQQPISCVTYYAMINRPLRKHGDENKTHYHCYIQCKECSRSVPSARHWKTRNQHRHSCTAYQRTASTPLWGTTAHGPVRTPVWLTSATDLGSTQRSVFRAVNANGHRAAGSDGPRHTQRLMFKLSSTTGTPYSSCL